MAFIGRDDDLIDPAKVYTGGDKSRLNAKLPPTDPDADTEFSYLTTDGSDDAPYIDA